MLTTSAVHTYIKWKYNRAVHLHWGSENNWWPSRWPMHGTWLGRNFK